jgi:hypothetical protein
VLYPDALVNATNLASPYGGIWIDQDPNNAKVILVFLVALYSTVTGSIKLRGDLFITFGARVCNTNISLFINHTQLLMRKGERSPPSPFLFRCLLLSITEL